MLISFFGWSSEILSLLGLWLAARTRIGWLIGFVGSMCWVAYGVLLHQPPIYCGAVAYLAVNFRNMVVDHRTRKVADEYPAGC